MTQKKRGAKTGPASARCVETKGYLLEAGAAAADDAAGAAAGASAGGGLLPPQAEEPVAAVIAARVTGSCNVLHDRFLLRMSLERGRGRRLYAPLGDGESIGRRRHRRPPIPAHDSPPAPPHRGPRPAPLPAPPPLPPRPTTPAGRSIRRRAVALLAVLSLRRIGSRRPPRSHNPPRAAQMVPTRGHPTPNIRDPPNRSRRWGAISATTWRFRATRARRNPRSGALRRPLTSTSKRSTSTPRILHQPEKGERASSTVTVILPRRRRAVVRRIRRASTKV